LRTVPKRRPHGLKAVDTWMEHGSDLEESQAIGLPYWTYDRVGTPSLGRDPSSPRSIGCARIDTKPSSQRRRPLNEFILIPAW